MSVNRARLCAHPKAPKKLPEVMITEQTNSLLDGVTAGRVERPFPARDRARFRADLRMRTARERTGRR